MKSIKINDQQIQYAPIFDGYFYSSFHSQEKPSEFWKNEDILIKTIKKSADFFNPDIVMLEETAPANMMMMGCKIDLSYGFVPLFVSKAVNNKSDIEKITPFSKKGGAAQRIIPELTRHFKGQRLTTCAVKAPFETAFVMRGGSEFMIDLKKDPVFITEMLDVVWDAVKPVIKDLAEFGVDIITIKDSVASSSLISPATYEQFAFLLEKKMVEEIKFNNMIPLLHICKKSSPIFKLMVNTGASILECDSQNNFEEIINLLKKDQCLKGNIDSVSELEEDFEIFYKNRLPNLCKLSDQSGKIIISTGDSITPNTSHDKLLKIEKFVRNYNNE